MLKLRFHSPRGTGTRLEALTFLGATVLISSSGVAQLNAHRPSGDLGLRGVGIIGNTSVQRSTEYESLYQRRSEGGEASPGNFSSLAPGQGAVSGGRMTGAASLRSPGGAGASTFMSGFGGSFFQIYTNPAFDGRNLFQNYRDPPPVPISARNSFMFHHMLSAMREGGTSSTAHPVYGHEIRDDLARQSLLNAVPAENRLQAGAQRQSLPELLAARIGIERDKAVQQGWTLVGSKHFQRAIPRFEAAEAADPHCTEARLGIFSAAAADESLALAESALRRIVRNDADVFRVALDLRSRLGDPDLIERITSLIGRAARQDPENAGMAAMNAFFLWFLGQRDEALRVAEQIHRDHRTSPFASMAARMRGETPPIIAAEGPG